MVISLSLTISTNRVFADSFPSVPSGYYLISSEIQSFDDTSPENSLHVFTYLPHNSTFKSFVYRTGGSLIYLIMCKMDDNTPPNRFEVTYSKSKYSSSFISTWDGVTDGIYYYYFSIGSRTRRRLPSDIPCYIIKSDFEDMSTKSLVTIFWNGNINSVADSFSMSVFYPTGYVPVFKNWLLRSPNALNVIYMQSIGLPMSGYHSAWTSGKPPVPEPTEPPEPTNPPSPEPTNPPIPEPTNPPIDNTLIKNQPIVEYWDTFVKGLQGVFNEHLNNIEGLLSDIKQGLKDIKDETTNIINNPKQTNFWDFLKEVISTFISDFFETLQNAISDFFDFTEHTIDLLDKAFRAIGNYIADRLDFLFVPSDSQQSEIKTKIANLKEKSGGIGQLSDTVIGYYNGFESVVESGQVIFQWSDIAIPDGTVIPGGAFNVSQCIVDSGFAPLQETVKIVFTFTVVVVSIKRCLKHILKMLGVDISL